MKRACTDATQRSLVSLGFKRALKESSDASTSSDVTEPDREEDEEDEADEDRDEASTSSSEVTRCSSKCCNPDREGPYQPSSKKVLETTKQMQAKQARYVQSSWFGQHPWLTFCETKKKLFCFYCSVAESRKLLHFSTKAEDAFTKVGFCNWKKASQCFVKHENSHAHSEACMKIHNKTNVASLLSEACRKEQSVRAEMLLKQLSSLKFLLRQGLAIRGHDDQEGNLYQLLKLLSQDSVEMQSWLLQGKYLSPVIVNEQIKLMSDFVLRGLLNEIRCTQWFTLIADEATDISNKEQMCVVIRWVDDMYEINEDPIGLIQLPKTDANTLTSALKDVLVRCILPLSQCRGQAYDGASAMSGRIKGVATQIKNEQPAALHVHCLAHCLNLCLQDATRICNCVRDTLELIMELVKLIKFSPKRSTLFQTLKSQMSPDTNDLRPLCPTRWTVRTGAIGAVLSNYSTLCTVLEEVNSTGRDEYAVKAGGILRQMEKFSTYFGLKLCFLVFSSTEQLSCTLQQKDITIQEARGAAVLAESHLRRQRNDEVFDRFYESVLHEARDLTEEPVLPRKRRVPKRTSEEAEGFHHQCPKEHYRQIFFEVLDVICNELVRRFDQKDFKMVVDLEQAIVRAGNGEKGVLPEAIKDLYKDDIDMDRLATHLHMLQDVLKRYGESAGRTIKVTNVRTVCQAMNDVPGAKALLSEIHRFLKLFLTIPVTTATSERLKTYLRSSMTQERLNHVLLLHSHKSRTDQIDIKQIATSFISANDRRQMFFGKM